MMPAMYCDGCEKSIFCCICSGIQSCSESIPLVTNPFDNIDLTTIQSPATFDLMNVGSLFIDTTYVESSVISPTTDNSLIITLTGDIDLISDNLKSVKLSNPSQIFPLSEGLQSTIQWDNCMDEVDLAGFDSQEDHLAKYVSLVDKTNRTEIITKQFNTLQVDCYPSNGGKNITIKLTFEFKPNISPNRWN